MGFIKIKKLTMNAPLCSILGREGGLKEDMVEAGSDSRGDVGRASHSRVCSGDRHSSCCLCGLGKVCCMYEPQVSWDDRGVPRGLSKRARGAGTTCSSRGSMLATAGSGISEEKRLLW